MARCQARNSSTDSLSRRQASCRLIEPFRTAATTIALRRTTHRLVSGEGRSGTVPSTSSETLVSAKGSAKDMFLGSKWPICGRYPAFFKEALNGRRPCPQSCCARAHPSGSEKVPVAVFDGCQSSRQQQRPLLLNRTLLRQPGKVCEINIVKCDSGS